MTAYRGSPQIKPTPVPTGSASALWGGRRVAAELLSVADMSLETPSVTVDFAPSSYQYDRVIRGFQGETRLFLGAANIFSHGSVTAVDSCHSSVTVSPFGVRREGATTRGGTRRCSRLVQAERCAAMRLSNDRCSCVVLGVVVELQQAAQNTDRLQAPRRGL